MGFRWILCKVFSDICGIFRGFPYVFDGYFPGLSMEFNGYYFLGFAIFHGLSIGFRSIFSLRLPVVFHRFSRRFSMGIFEGFLLHVHGLSIGF